MVQVKAPWEQPFVGSARKWLSEALAGWADNDYTKVVALSPIAVEHLCKAALWRKNPALLSILSENHQKSFVNLLLDPNLSDPTIRTIGLTESLSRVCSVYSVPLPIDSVRKSRLIAARGGALHGGAVRF